MSGCLLCLHLDLGLKTGFEFKVEVILENGDVPDRNESRGTGSIET